MPRRNNRWVNHQSIGVIGQPSERHTCEPVPNQYGHVCLHCGRPVEVKR